MSVFQDLCSAMKDCEERDHRFCQMARGMANSFAEALREYIEAPQSWTKEVDGNKSREHYVSTVPVDDGWNEFREKSHPLSNMSFTKDNFYRFKTSLILEHSPNSYPKRRYSVDCGVKPEKTGECILFIGMPGTSLHRVFQCPLLEVPEGVAAAKCDYDAPVKYCVELVMDQLGFDPFADEATPKK